MVTLTACAAPYGSHKNQTDCDIRIGGAVLSGKAGALVDLLLFTDKTDGEATLDHGSVLLALRDHVRIQRFDSISRSLGDDRKQAIDSLVETAEKLHPATVQMLGRTDRR